MQFLQQGKDDENVAIDMYDQRRLDQGLSPQSSNGLQLVLEISGENGVSGTCGAAGVDGEEVGVASDESSISAGTKT